jgi:CMP-N-acetylneuraminic acid synthetase
VHAAREHDSALTVTESHRFLWRGTQDGSLVGVNHDHHVRLRRQDIQFQEFAENGAAYAMDVAQFRSIKHRFFGRIGHVLMPAIRSIEIDEPADLDFANVIADFLAVRTRP